MQKKDLIKLLDKIDDLDEAYYNESKQLVSDAEYDGLKDQLRTASTQFEVSGSKADNKLIIRIRDAITRVGAPPPKDGKWNKVQHEVPMTSLNKVNLPSELKDWSSKCGVKETQLMLWTEKLDGLSVSLKYENGKLIQGLTRGSGEEGEDITRNVKRIKGVPHYLSGNFTGHIRGEILLFHSDWKTYCPEMSNSRNGASGISKRIDGHQVEHLTVMAYTVDGKDFDTEEETFEWLKDIGFKVPNYGVADLDSINKRYQEYMDRIRDTLDYDIDGLVIRINDRAHQLSLGEEAHRPMGAIAFKFEAPEARTTIRNIVWQVGDTGRITPVAEFDEVELLGANVTRASLHNISNVQTLGVNIGAEVIVSRRNDVIPFVEKVLSKSGDCFIPNTCPDCGSNTIRVGEYLVCANKKSCPAQVIGRLNKWIKELNILEWGESVLTKLIQSGKVNDVADLYLLKAEDIVSLDRMGEKGAKKLLDELGKFRCIPLENFFGGLCIDGVATSIVRSVIDAGYNTMDKILSISVSQLECIPGFGEIRAQAFHDGLVENADRIEAILDAGVTIKQRASGSLNGKKVCFTGSMNTPRAKLQKMVEDAGGIVDKSVGKGTVYLVTEDENSTSSKIQAARRLGIKILSESDFMSLVHKKSIT